MDPVINPIDDLSVSLENLGLDEIPVDEFNKFTHSIYKKFSREYRNKHGIFFTSHSQVQKCLDLIEPHLTKSIIKILEPSCGSGQFLDNLAKWVSKTNKTASIHYVEKDSKIYKKINQHYACSLLDEPNIIDVLSLNDDFLLTEDLVDLYDLIIGNPPYFEIGQSDYKSTLSKGRYNIYALFVEHSIKLLAPDGILCFVLPQTLMTSPSFSKLRIYIKSQCNIVNIFNLNNFSSEVSQSVNIYIFQRLSNTTKSNQHYILMGNLFSFTKQNINYDQYSQIKDLGTVTTGSIVWNQHKDSLNNEKKGHRLIYSDDVGNISSSILKTRTTAAKKNYIITTKSPVILPAIFIIRGTSLKYELVPSSPYPLIAENHVNVITGTLPNLKLICSGLDNPKLKEYLKNIYTTLNISKTQLESLPIMSSS